MGNARTYFKDYVDTIKGFNDFHNEVINMPRPDFENMGLQILRVIASLLDFLPSFSFTVLEISPGSNSITNLWHVTPYLKVLF